MKHYRQNSDDTLRRAHREWGSSGTPEDYKAFVVERGRMGLHGAVSPEPRGARALLAAWPRYKSGKRKGEPRRKITYGLATNLIRTYYSGAGWDPKIWRATRPDPRSPLPTGFPPERDPGEQTVPMGAWISPDFTTYLDLGPGDTGRGRTATFMVWSQEDERWSGTLGAAARWEPRALNWGLPWGALDTFDKKRLAFLLLDASLRVEDPYMPNPPRDDAAEVYVSPRERELTPREAHVREVAIGLKHGGRYAVQEAADAMAPLVPHGSVLIPVPGHRRGSPGIGTSWLAHAIAAMTGSRVADVLVRSHEVQSSRERRRGGRRGLSAKTHAASMRTRIVPPGNLVLIDNVVVSGATFEGARRALGRPDALGVAYARGRDVILPQANPPARRFFHVSLSKHEPSILSKGLIPQTGERSEAIGEASPATFLFPNEEELQNALFNWLGEELPEDEAITTYAVDLPEGFPVFPTFEGPVSWEWYTYAAIPPHMLTVHAREPAVPQENPPALLPPLGVQRRVAASLDEVTSAADKTLARARRSVSLAKQLRMAHLQQAFGSAREIHERLNPVQGLGGLIELRVGGEGDFYIQRSGGENTVGRPFREAFQGPGEARRGPGDPRHHIGVTVLRPDVLDPRYLFYVAEYAWRSQIYRRLCHGTLRLQHLRLKDVSCGLSAVLSGVKKNPVSDRGRYRFVHACPAAHCGEDIQALVDASREITYRTFRAKADPDDVRELIASLGYDHHFPITRDLWHIGFRKSVYRGVPAIYLVHSAIEHIFTLDGELGPSLLEGPRKPDPIADAWQAQAQAKTKWGRWTP